MAATRRAKPRSSRFGTVLRALVRLVLLLTVGFGMGVVIGLALEEPALIYGHLAGAGESIDLEDAMAAAEPIIEAPIALTNEPGVGFAEEATTGAAGGASTAQSKRIALRREDDRATGLPKVAARKSVESDAKARDRAREPAAKVASSVAPGDSWAIQVGAFAEEAAARRLMKSLETKGYPVALLPSDAASARWRVRVQPLRGEDKARGIASRLKTEEGLPTWVMSVEAGSR